LSDLPETDEDWTQRIGTLVREQGEVEEIERHEDCPERIAKNEFFFYPKYSDEWPAFRVVVEPVAGPGQLKQWKVKWAKIPTNYNPLQSTLVEARTAEAARAFVKDHIERTTGFDRSEIVVREVTEYSPPTEGKVISG